MERRFAAVLHHMVQRLMDSVRPALVHLLTTAAGSPEPDQASSPRGSCRELDQAPRCEPAVAAIRGHLEFLAPALDPRVLRRTARELWNSSAGVRALVAHLCFKADSSSTTCSCSSQRRESLSSLLAGMSGLAAPHCQRRACTMASTGWRCSHVASAASVRLLQIR